MDDRARAACDAGDFVRAASLIAAALDRLSRVLPPGCPPLAHEHAKLARLRFNAHADAKAGEALQRAAEMMRACYGEEEEEVEDLRRLATLCRA